MAEIIKCPHADACKTGEGRVQVLVTDDGGYVELCSMCLFDLADELVADMSLADFKEALKHATEGVI